MLVLEVMVWAVMVMIEIMIGGCPISFGALSFFCKKLQFYFAMSDIFRIFAFVNQYDNPWQR